MRNALTAQHDQNCIVVVTGPATNLAELLDLPNAKPIIESKVKMLVMMGGAYPDGEPEFNIKADIDAARKVFAEWPTPIVASGFEVGSELAYPAESIETDFAWAADHPVVDAYRALQDNALRHSDLGSHGCALRSTSRRRLLPTLRSGNHQRA